MERKLGPGAAIAHGGVGSPPDRADGPRNAVDAALQVLESAGDPLEAAIAGAMVLEDDPRFNAGTGSRIRLDGETVQMDASVMSSDGRFGAVAAVERIRNPVLAARAVLDTPHLLLAGDGATRFAHTFLPDYDPATAEMKARTQKLIAELQRNDSPANKSATFDFRKYWNFQKTLAEAGFDADQIGHDTIGVAVRAPDGRFAVALSTGGTAVTLRGRVGDVPVLGAGLFAGPEGAVACTGEGERIVEATLARRTYDKLASGTDPESAARQAVEELERKGQNAVIGVIVIGKDRLAAASDTPMAWAARELGSSRYFGP